MTKIFVAAWLVAAFVPCLQAQNISADEEAAIKKPALNYIEGWYKADAARMESAVHPELAKRMVGIDGKFSMFGSQGAMTLIQATRRGGGKNVPKELQHNEITILDHYDVMAVVKVVSYNYVDYLQEARTVEGEWKIVNVLWERNLANAKPSSGPTAAPPSAPR